MGLNGTTKAPITASASGPAWRSRQVRRALTTVATAAAGAVVALATAPSAQSAAPAAEVTHTFGFTGAVQTVTVPADVTGALVAVSGASGGTNVASGGNAAGGVGVTVGGTIAVQPGDTITVGVGGQGGQNNGNKSPGAGGWASSPAFVGGAGGRSHGATTKDGSGGGGASTLAVNGQLVVVAGAGGGGGGFGSLGGTYGGGAAGDATGSNGGKYLGKTGGRGGSAANPNLNRTGGSETGVSLSGGGGGGGGGRYGGEGGSKSVDGGGGGGGGSSLHTSVDNTTIAAAAAGNGSVTVTWQGPAASITGTPPQQYLGRTYNFAFTVTGSATVTLTAGTLPPGLSLGDAGTLTGVPTQAGTFGFTVTATNTLGSANLATTVTVLPTQAPTLVGNPPAATVGAAYQYQFHATGIPYATVIVTDPSDLPDGLELDGQTGTLSGTPTQAGTYRFTLIASNGVKPSARLNATLTVNAARVLRNRPAPPTAAQVKAAPTSAAHVEPAGSVAAHVTVAPTLADTGTPMVVPTAVIGIALLIVGTAVTVIGRGRSRRRR